MPPRRFEFRMDPGIVGLEDASLSELAQAAKLQALNKIAQDYPQFKELLSLPQTQVNVTDTKQNAGHERGDFLVSVIVVDDQKNEHHFLCACTPQKNSVSIATI